MTVEEDRVYVALIADIRGSRQSEDRAALQARFQEAVARANQQAAGGLAARLVITTGDEVQGLFEGGRAAVDALVALADAMAPAGMRFGLGVGALETPLRAEAIGMDGPCFHRAREALERAEHRSLWGVARSRQGEPSRLDLGASGILSLMGAVRDGWTQRQTEYVRAVRGARTQKAVAEAFEVSPSVVSESLKAARFHELLEAEQGLAALLEELARNGRTPQEGRG